ncbi:PREDICTED: uncharacterized protein LOC107167553, partial [Diuraphis noxia]|uniref:uncharacterized protein LOC107167553 n=1 Tax=Diuraphis noxia TaxID=143948 RepID=UPI0007638484
MTAKECFEFNTIMIKPKSKHTIRHILELPSSLPPSKRPAAKPPDAPWTKRRKLILPPVNKQNARPFEMQGRGQWPTLPTPSAATVPDTPNIEAKIAQYGKFKGI